MTRPELIERLAALCDQSGLPLGDKTYALRAALTRVQMNVSAQAAAVPSRKVEWPQRQPSSKGERKNG
jgi:hypothetical protein